LAGVTSKKRTEPQHRTGSGVRYRKIVIIEAWKAGTDEFPDHVRRDLRLDPAAPSNMVYDKLHATWIPFVLGDYIAEGADGEHYPIRGHIFERTYQKVE
jgi:hypothetical protein